MTARTLMIQGTASSVGKSLLTTALCRIYHRAGLCVSPFKAQNMSLNSAVAAGGGEIGRAQALQAEAAGIAASVDMNPILIKPEGDTRSQVVLMGRPIGSMGTGQLDGRQLELKAIIAEALARLRARNDLVIIEGAGSPAEVNLKGRDLANMHVAHLADAPVLLVGNIDRGGVFASLVGTLELLEPDERQRVAALVVNKFRGDKRLLAPGLDFLVQRTGLPVLGVLPFLRGLRLADEDSTALDDRRERALRDDQIVIAVVRFPRISNFDDFKPLEHEPGVNVRYVMRPQDLEKPDLVILPGSKCTTADLGWLRETGLAAAIAARANRHQPLLGICGGCQMLGTDIHDPHRIESVDERVAGLGLLPLATHFKPFKISAHVHARIQASCLLGDTNDEVTGYEMHMGTAELADGAAPTLEIVSRNGVNCEDLDGAVAADGLVVGTLVHGLFDNESVRAAILRFLRSRRGLPEPEVAPLPTSEAEIDRLARSVLEAIDWPLLCRITGLSIPPPSFEESR
jgi:adenosylcobyric acid synthase